MSSEILRCSRRFPIRMACPLCGDRCTCSSAITGSVIAGTRVAVLIEPKTETAAENFELSESVGLRTKTRSAGALSYGSSSAEAAVAIAPPQKGSRAENPDWRDEVASRVQAHRARRRRRYDPESSLSLAFNAAVSSQDAAAATSTPVYHRTSSAPELNAELSGADEGENPRAEGSSAENSFEETRPTPYRRILLKPPISAEAQDVEDNLIQFPFPVEPEALFEDELAEPLFYTPRILDSPDEREEETTTLPPVATVHLDEFVYGLDTSSDVGHNGQIDDHQIELPLQVAPVGARTMCALTDAAVVLTASALFSVIVLTIAKFVPQGRLASVIAVLLPLILWAAYHYIFLVYAGATLGMQMAQLQLSSFEGCSPTRRVRGWRALSMILSCTSLGLGFAWAMVDEDRLGWHDRITRTYLRLS